MLSFRWKRKEATTTYSNNTEWRCRRVLFRGSQTLKKSNKKCSSLPGNHSTCRDSAPKSFGTDLPGRAAFCISGVLQVLKSVQKPVNRIRSSAVKKGSLTVEAAFALPLFFLTVISMISLMGNYGSFVKEMVVLQQSAEEAAAPQVYSMQENSRPVRLYRTVKAELPFLPFPAATLQVRVAASVRPWIGRIDSSAAGGESSEGQLYYISDYQSVYHTSSDCSYLNLQIRAWDAGRVSHAKNDGGEHYQPCEVCIGKGAVGSVVYLTDGGEHYHNSPECNGLKRSVHLADEEEISGLHMCTRCSRREDHT